VYYTDWAAIPKGQYSVIYADPPWPYKDKMAGHSFSLDHEYATQPMKWIKQLPVGEIAAKDAALLLWVPSPQLVDGLDVLKSWGFKYKTIAFVWSKLTVHGREVANMGRWTMGNVEIVLLGTRGRPQRAVKNIRQLVTEIRTVHSRKPDEVKRRIERLFDRDPRERIELFARGTDRGWDQFGNQEHWP
jgi:N6-adenosine-specific RNA methylase IME4